MLQSRTARRGACYSRESSHTRRVESFVPCGKRKNTYHALWRHGNLKFPEEMPDAVSQSLALGTPGPSLAT